MDEQQYYNDYMNDNFDEPKSKKDIFDELKKADKGYYSWFKRVEGSRKPHKVEVYGSGDVGSRIRDPITGDRYKNYFVGSKNEDLFFKVKMATGEFGGRDGPTLFYSSPEEYEKHTKSFLSQETKDNWLAKKSRADAQHKKEVEKEEAQDKNYSIFH
jgi:hypothetical protein